MLRSSQVLVALALLFAVGSSKDPLHIVMIVADDYGWYDVGYHGSDLKTPTIDAMAAAGIKLESYYVQPVCTPSRCAFMTGRYPMRYGRQGGVIMSDQPMGLDLTETIMPQVLKTGGYATHAIGKWHLGFFQWPYTPTYRGFDSYLGYWGGGETYTTHAVGFNGIPYLDMRADKAIVREQVYSSNMYADEAIKIINAHPKDTPLFLYVAMQATHGPLEAPPGYEEHCSYIPASQKGRQVFCGMTWSLDEAVKNISAALNKTGLMDNTLFVFTTDNGGIPDTSGYNWPLRGGKATFFEGGIRGVSFVYGNMIKYPGTKSTALLHAVDWLPTFAEAAGITYTYKKPLDGLSAWKLFTQDNTASIRDTLLHNADNDEKAAIRYKNWKYIPGTQLYDDWYQPPQTYGPSKTKGPYLFDISADPNEKNNVVGVAGNAAVVKQLQQLLADFTKQQVPEDHKPDDPRANPAHFNNTWTPWL